MNPVSTAATPAASDPNYTTPPKNLNILFPFTFSVPGVAGSASLIFNLPFLAPTYLHTYIPINLLPNLHIAQMLVLLSCYFQNSKILLPLIRKQLTIFTTKKIRTIRQHRAHIRRAKTPPPRPPPAV